MKFTDYLIIAAIALISLVITEVIMPGAFHKILMGLALFGFIWAWVNN